MFTVSHKLRPAFGFEQPLEIYCLHVSSCKSALENFFRSNSINLGVTLSPYSINL